MCKYFFCVTKTVPNKGNSKSAFLYIACEKLHILEKLKHNLFSLSLITYRKNDLIMKFDK